MSSSVCVEEHCFVGIDVSKATLDIATEQEGLILTVDNNEVGIEQCLDLLARRKPQRIVVESSGGYERLLVSHLRRSEYPVALVNPTQSKALAIALGTIAKTDPLDAHNLARFAKLVSPTPLGPIDESRESLAALTIRRRQLRAARVREVNRQGTARPEQLASILAHIAVLDEFITDIDAQIDTLICSTPEFSAKAVLLKSVPGVGPITANTLIAELPELGSINRKKIAALVGLAPYNRDSGTLQRHRSIRGGRTAVRTALYMAALSASRHNPIIKPYYQRLIADGKLNKVALIACERKLLSILNSMVRDNSFWRYSN